MVVMVMMVMMMVTTITTIGGALGHKAGDVGDAIGVAGAAGMTNVTNPAGQNSNRHIAGGEFLVVPVFNPLLFLAGRTPPLLDMLLMARWVAEFSETATSVNERLDLNWELDPE
eukprot:CAMPEP_0175049248 /NCGR_PEP_ID=MMETSP0052_2-20121109/6631_1 /TAXON_ID=51329 ORGANISM="Polytomella parva, Strain SAG 63-3" /NCGR_SAMPLE_ID=MMETSP0052_2 /ASSEMBLY_ACC=CAM_ASM_000194 /LENGTH=113 /DNA_ID=CAMNT_0016313385 /DNA_START=591 /DNA_END=933 /DNA_ORIENTATION=+